MDKISVKQLFTKILTILIHTYLINSTCFSECIYTVNNTIHKQQKKQSVPQMFECALHSFKIFNFTQKNVFFMT